MMGVVRLRLPFTSVERALFFPSALLFKIHRRRQGLGVSIIVDLKPDTHCLSSLALGPTNSFVWGRRMMTIPNTFAGLGVRSATSGAERGAEIDGAQANPSRRPECLWVFEYSAHHLNAGASLRQAMQKRINLGDEVQKLDANAPQIKSHDYRGVPFPLTVILFPIIPSVLLPSSSSALLSIWQRFEYSGVDRYEPPMSPRCAFRRPNFLRSDLRRDHSSHFPSPYRTPTASRSTQLISDHRGPEPSLAFYLPVA